MKKLFVVSLAVSAVFFSSAQQLVDDFETNSLNWQNVSCYSDIRVNDYKTEANMSDKVLYVQRDAACDNWSGAIYTPETPMVGYDYLHVMMYRNNTHQPNLKVADNHPTGGAVDLLPMNEIVSGAWQDVVFNISDFEAVNFIMFMVDRTELTETAWMLCDEVMLSNDPTPRTTIEVGGDDSDEDNNASSDEIGTGETDGYHLVWADYFNDGELDEETWNIEVNGNGGGNNELQYYRAENVSVGTEPISGKGCLILTAQKEEFGGKQATSGRINSKNKLYFKHGKIEASVKMPRTANGLWPAFWMMGNDYDLVGWPKCGEIDILEMGNAQGIQNGTQDRYFNGACHWGFYNEQGQYPNYAKASTNSYGMQDDFHLFTLYWDQNELRMYLDQDKYPDAEPYYVMGISDTNGDWATGNYFHKSFFVLFNLAIGGNFTGIWDINQITALNNGPASMYVDFVKIYQKGTDDETFMDEGTGTGLKQTEEDNFCCYPNPTCDVFSFSVEAQRVVVTDLTGRVIYEAENVSKVDARNWVAGIYMAKVQINDKIYTKQIIKK